MKIEILGISFDKPAANKAFAEKFSYPFRLLSDVDRKVALAYGACESAKDRYPRRFTFVIGPDGKVEDAIDTKDAGGQAGALLESL